MTETADIISGMLAHNGTEPDLIAEERRFTVRLWKGTEALMISRESKRLLETLYGEKSRS